MQTSPTSLSPKNCTPDIPDSSPGHPVHPVSSSAVSTQEQDLTFQSSCMGHSKKCGYLFLIAGAVILTFAPQGCCVSITNTVKKTIFPSQDLTFFKILLFQSMTAEYNQ